MSLLATRGAGAALLTALCLTWLPAPPAASFSVGLAGNGSDSVIRWLTRTIPYYLHPDCAEGLPQSTCHNVLEESWAAWMGHACTNVNFVNAGMSNNLALTSAGYSTNGKNEVAWLPANQWFYGYYTLGVTAPVFYTDGEIIEADIVFNGQHEWSTSGNINTTDVMNVAVHEMGHAFGLQHNLGGYDLNNPPTMAPTADNSMKTRTPEADDLLGLCFLLPATDYTCTSNADCPLVVDDGPDGEFYAGQIPCTGGLCGGISNTVPSGEGPLGSGCASDVDCADPYECYPLTNGQGICTQSCSNDANCPSGYQCQGGVCLPASGGGDGNKKANGEICDSPEECLSYLCVYDDTSARCRQPCSSDADCASGEYCAELVGTGGGACIPSNGSDDTSPSGKKTDGQPCDYSSECESELCVGTETEAFCRTPCNNDSDCSPGEVCVQLTGGGGACVPSEGGTAKQNGQSCEDSSECESGLCAGSDADGYVCTEACETDADCPPSYVCLPFSAGGGGCFFQEQRGLGELCDSNTDCASGQCIRFDGEDYFCTDSCDSNEDCPCGMTCTETTDGGALCNLTQADGCLPSGSDCSADTECLSGSCVDGICAATCSIFQLGMGCLDEQGCARITTEAPEGICRAQGTAALGAACQNDLNCESLFCHDGQCAQPCNPFGPSSCPADQGCVQISTLIGQCAEEGMNGPLPPGSGEGENTENNSGSNGEATPSVSAGSNNGVTSGQSRGPKGCTALPAHRPSLWLAFGLLLLIGCRRRRALFLRDT